MTEIINRYIKGKKDIILTYILMNDNISKDDIKDILSTKVKQINYMCILDKHCGLAEGYNNVKIYCNSVLKNLKNLKNSNKFKGSKQGIIYIDYSTSINSDTNLYIEGVELNDIINEFGKVAKKIIIKLPKKFDFKMFIKGLKCKAMDIYNSHNSDKYHIAINCKL